MGPDPRPTGPSGADRSDATAGGGPPAGARVLRATAGRAVWRERRDGRVVVVKALRRTGRLGRARARRRCEHEQRIASGLRAAGLPVPEPLGVEPRGPAWCSVWGAVRAARPLEAWLDGSGPRPPAPPARLARDLGRLVAALQRAGLAQDDWHPGNLLLDRRGGWHALDFHLARRRRPDPGRGGRELARLAGAVLAQVGPGPVLLAHRAWARAWGLPRPDRAAGARLLAAARRSRRRTVEAHLDRWSRVGGRLGPEADLLLARGSEALARRALTELGPRPARLAAGEGLELVLDGRRVVAIGERPAAARRRWLDAARLFEHRLPGLVPLARPARAPRWLLFERRADPPPTREAALALLDERGLEWRPAAPSRPEWWPLEREGDHSSPSAPSSFRFSRTKSRIRGTC